MTNSNSVTQSDLDWLSARTSQALLFTLISLVLLTTFGFFCFAAARFCSRRGQFNRDEVPTLPIYTIYARQRYDIGLPADEIRGYIDKIRAP